MNIGLPSYLANGEFKPTTYQCLLFNPDELEFVLPRNSFTEAHAEITEDIHNFIDYMKNSIYYAAGLEAFFKQELDKIQMKFKTEENDKSAWQFHVFEAIKENKLNIPFLQYKADMQKRKHIVKVLGIMKKQINEDYFIVN